MQKYNNNNPKEWEIGNEYLNKFFEDSLRGNPSSYHFNRISRTLIDNKSLPVFYDPVKIKAKNNEEYLIMLYKNGTLGGIDKHFKEEVINKHLHNFDYRNSRHVNKNLVYNPITFAIQDTVMANDDTLEKDKRYTLSSVAGKPVVKTNRDDRYTIFSNDDLTDSVSPSSYKKHNLIMPFIIDKFGNFFLLRTNYTDIKKALLTVSKLVTLGIEEFSENEKDKLPILHKYIEDRSSERFNFNNFESISIREDKDFNLKFTEILDQVRVKSYYEFKGYGAKIDKAFFKRKADSSIVRFSDDENNSYIILPNQNQFSMEKRTFDIYSGRAINKLTTENMYDFINEENQIYFVDNMEETHDFELFNQPRKGSFLYEMIDNDAMNHTIQLYLYHIYAFNNDVELYHEFTVKKKEGGNKKRIIHAPNEELKGISKKINKTLTQSVETAVNNNGLDDVMIGYRKGKNIQDNALMHANNTRVIKADFEGYFDSISVNYCRDVIRFLAHPNKNEEYKTYHNNYLASTQYQTGIYNLFEATMFNPKTKGLYMGNPISGAMSNLVIMKVVKFLNNICKNKGITFTIYADDLTFSIKDNSKENKKILNESYIEYIIDHVLSELNMDYRVRVNEEKTMTMKNQKRRITGIRLNDSNELTWDRHKYRELRVIFHKLSQGADFSELSMTKNQLKGNIAFFKYTVERNEDLGKNVGDNKMIKLINKYEDVLVDKGIISKGGVVNG